MKEPEDDPAIRPARHGEAVIAERVVLQALVDAAAGRDLCGCGATTPEDHARRVGFKGKEARYEDAFSSVHAHTDATEFLFGEANEDYRTYLFMTAGFPHPNEAALRRLLDSARFQLKKRTSLRAMRRNRRLSRAVGRKT